ncbi:bifunctional 4-hydroxy-2-oxoglutarate aldolase/2-dehydro-3-deoxy-phosphogluconate aldolase [Poseidonibacter ostreae]|jgi:2-dehydro-3-deoxyphosphogluconate aldolase / (4S)-4-hydroxy-2-oxoglutarate aldolase|uniref:2-dehydro-3-deoxy-phosphogluconate aldolase n=1 Tax=Poseidonibacter ostreae TaxID=2654171 RepID=A0A6L4WVR3_9BACT|nr:bifunctional 4-hydroxy-2-oxoglutarate aldolase/2-dehydro-3-deoxy-phosphogluconate aldolase [Poseidonibacter ostreae]KAB7886841.1 bifunctional 4-hydroxy-2-oxoglutarate aldolase/2-dehydro-3-deoxy-phosphogluconate aldolase [Poseidonibacter ostreae]KAB7890484.1 bifunctional 4-hydroxy-2-oxoglutarate aldolase/2-dehydro-3-deoxy-phosphogluconate aldolase [Poseidonibacter ostreae]KAB7890923.1 bifunctional 4-hydroxy-2-oxoglutarate aldolase/2-dehydro-3-deoxy-phosphogluconate aldolase [Poseidonibacter os
MINEFKNSPVIPVLTFNDVNESLKISEILIQEGLTNLEITLRTPNAMSCIEAIVKEFPMANVGAGTIIKKEQLLQVQNIGCTFAVSPGATSSLIQEAKRIDMNYLPGASTPSEIISLIEDGIFFQKFFHAGNSGGYKMLQAYANIFEEVQFCPTGGIGQKDFQDYLNLKNVVCLGGSWMVNTKTMSLNDIQIEAKSITSVI